MPNHFSSPSTPSALRRVARSLAIVGVTAAAAVLAGSTDAAAETELAVNALAPQITTSADRAVQSYDTYLEYGEFADFVAYEALRADTARLAARQLGYPEAEMVDAWRSTSLLHQRAVLAAMTQVGVPYRSHTSIEDEGFDCSGLTLYAWGEAGVELNRISGDQIRATDNVGRDGAEAGDLVHYPGHVMMYLGVDDAIVHSVNTGRTVEIDTISNRRANSVRFGDPISS